MMAVIIIITVAAFCKHPGAQSIALQCLALTRIDSSAPSLKSKAISEIFSLCGSKAERSRGMH